MTTDDRDFHFLMTTLHTGDKPREEVVDWLTTTVRPAWQSLVDAGVLHSGRALWRTRDYDMPAGGVEWTLVLLAEVEGGVDPETAAEREQKALVDNGFALGEGMRMLALDTVRRNAGSGTPLPRPGRHHPALPPTWRAAVVLVDFPEEHRPKSDLPMRDFHGPVSQDVLDDGDAYRVLIGDVVDRRWGDATTAPWNGLAIVDADWDNDGFADAVRRIVPRYESNEALMKVVYEVDALRRSRQTSLSDELREVGVGEL